LTSFDQMGRSAGSYEQTTFFASSSEEAGRKQLQNLEKTMSDFSRKTDEQLLTIIKKGQQAFFQTANAIYEIDRRKLWKTSHKSLVGFCEVEFGMNQADVSRYKNAARALMNLADFKVLPTCEGQTRELVRLRHAEPQKKVWQAVLDLVSHVPQPITAKLIRQTAEHVLGNGEEEQSEPEIKLTGVGKLVQVVQLLSGIVIDPDEHGAAREQLELIQSKLDDLRSKLVFAVAA